MHRCSSLYIEVPRSRHVPMHLHILHAHVAVAHHKAHGPLGVVVCGLQIVVNIVKIFIIVNAHPRYDLDCAGSVTLRSSC